jgi:hypothetical protein
VYTSNQAFKITIPDIIGTAREYNAVDIVYYAFLRETRVQEIVFEKTRFI